MIVIADVITGPRLIAAVWAVGDPWKCERVNIWAIKDFVTKGIADRSVHECGNAQQKGVAPIANAIKYFISVVRCIDMSGQTELSQVAHAIGPLGSFLRRGQCREKHRRQNGDDSNDDQQFD